MFKQRFNGNQERTSFLRPKPGASSAMDGGATYRRLAEQVEDSAVRELRLYIDNTRPLYEKKMRMYARLALFVAKKSYNRELAVKLFEYLTKDAAVQYSAEFGTQPRAFDVATRRAVAESLRDGFEQDLRAQEYDFVGMLPKKYQAVPLQLEHSRHPV